MALKTLFIIALTTSRMIFPGTSAFSPGQDKIDMPEMKSSVRSISFELTSDKSGNQREASVTLPPGLKIGDSASLLVINPTPPEKTTEDAKITQKTYWGSSDNVQPGQPSVSTITNADETVAASADQDIKSLAYWPHPGIKGRNIGQVKQGATAAGTYALNTNYAGNTSIELSAEQEFLAPIQIEGLATKLDASKPIKLSWKAVPNALAYHVVVYGGNEKTSITWTAGAQAGADMDFGYIALSKEQVDKYLEQKILLPADTTSVTIPAKILTGSQGAMLSICAIGRDKIIEKDDICTQVILRSTLSAPLL